MLNLKRLMGTGTMIAAIFGAAALYMAPAARGSDHQDSITTVNRPSADITDVFMFPDPNTTSNVVLAMDTHPLIPAGMGSTTFFDPAVMYQFKIVHTATPYALNASNTPVEDTVIQFAVNGSGAGQTLTMHGPAAPVTPGTTSTYVTQTASTTIPIGANTTVNVTGPDGKQYPVQVYAGPRADPFYFDLAQFFKIVPDRYYAYHNGSATAPTTTVTSFRGFSGPSTCDTSPAHEFLTSGGADVVAAPTGGFDVMSIVVEMPKALLELQPGGTSSTTQPIVHLWATTSTTTGS